MNSHHNFVAVLLMCSLVFASLANAKELSIDIQSVTSLSASVESGVNAILLKFDIPAKLQDSRIDLAELYIQVAADANHPQPKALMICPITEDWTPSIGGLTDTEIAHDDTIGTMFYLRDLDSRRVDLNITEYLQPWIDSEYPNKGLMIKAIGSDGASFTTETPSFLTGGAIAKVKIYYTSPEKPAPEK